MSGELTAWSKGCKISKLSITFSKLKIKEVQDYKTKDKRSLGLQKLKIKEVQDYKTKDKRSSGLQN